MSNAGHFKPHKVGPIKPEVCKSLLTDSDWKILGCGMYSRGCIRIDAVRGTVYLDDMPVPMSWLERRCVKKCIRKRLEKTFKLAGRDFQHRGH